MSEKNLLSSVAHEGRYVTQIIHFMGGEKRTYHNIDSKSIRQGQFTKFRQKDGTWIMINDNNVLMVCYHSTPVVKITDDKICLLYTSDAADE